MTCHLCESMKSKEIKKLSEMGKVHLRFKSKSANIETTRPMDVSALPPSLPQNQTNFRTTIYKYRLLLLTFIMGVAIATSFHHEYFERKDFNSNALPLHCIASLPLVFYLFKPIYNYAFAHRIQPYEAFTKFLERYTFHYQLIPISIRMAYSCQDELSFIHLTKLAKGWEGRAQSLLRKIRLSYPCFSAVFNLPKSPKNLLKTRSCPPWTWLYSFQNNKKYA